MFEKSVLRRIFGSKRDEVTGEMGKLNDLYSSPTMGRIIKSRRIRWAGHVPSKGERRGVYRVLVRKPRKRASWKTHA
jgi:hypothetical protein